jgi:beta-carotene 3-hydroxylase
MLNFAIVVLTVVVMEGVAWAAHRYVMHGWGWGWHRSHHEPHDGPFERTTYTRL